MEVFLADIFRLSEHKTRRSPLKESERSLPVLLEEIAVRLRLVSFLRLLHLYSPATDRPTDRPKGESPAEPNLQIPVTPAAAAT